MDKPSLLVVVREFTDEGDYFSALSALDAMEGNPIHVNKRKALIYSDLGDFDKAFEYLDLAKEKGCSDRDYYQTSGLIKYKKGDIDGAIADTTISIESVDSYISYNNRACMKILAGDCDGAFADAEQAIRNSPKNYVPYIAMAHVLMKKGEYDGARAALKKSLRIKKTAHTYHILYNMEKQLGNTIHDHLLACHVLLTSKIRKPYKGMNICLSLMRKEMLYTDATITTLDNILVPYHSYVLKSAGIIDVDLLATLEAEVVEKILDVIYHSCEYDLRNMFTDVIENELIEKLEAYKSKHNPVFLDQGYDSTLTVTDGIDNTKSYNCHKAVLVVMAEMFMAYIRFEGENANEFKWSTKMPLSAFDVIYSFWYGKLPDIIDPVDCACIMTWGGEFMTHDNEYLTRICRCIFMHIGSYREALSDIASGFLQKVNPDDMQDIVSNPLFAGIFDMLDRITTENDQ